MRLVDRLTATLLLVAGLSSLALTLVAFVARIPVRVGSHARIRTTAGGYVEVPVPPQTYFQKYGVPELLLCGFGVLLVLVVALVLRSRGGHHLADAGKLAWSLAITGLVIGIVGSVTIAPYMLLVGILLVLACLAFSRAAIAASRTRASADAVTTRVAP